MPQSRWFLGLDIGGSRVRVGVIAQRDSSSQWHLLGEPLIIPTPPDPAELTPVLQSFLAKQGGGVLPEGIVGGIAGRIEGHEQVLAFAPRLTPAWRGKSLHRLAKEWMGGEVAARWFNDTVLVGLGELYHGAGVTSGIVAYLTISTGVGGCRFVDGQIETYEGSFEPGHIIIDAGGALCEGCAPCALDGECDWEAMISGSGVAARYSKPPETIPSDDPLWEELARWTAVGVRNIALLWTPQVIVIGGSMVVGDPAIPLEPVQEALRRHPLTSQVEVRKAQCGALGGLYGALVVVEQTEQRAGFSPSTR